MNIFGQVWLWSLLSFVAGVLLTWIVMVRPARKQVAALEDQLLEARSRQQAAPVAPMPVDDFEVDEWDTPRSLADDVLRNDPAPAVPYQEPRSEPQVEPVAAPFADPYAEQHASPAAEPVAEQVDEPVVEEHAAYDQDDAQRRFEEQLAEQRALTTDEPSFEEDRPRSLFERLSPDTEVPEERPAEQTTVLPLSGLEAADFDDEPELPAEQTQVVTTYEPTADVAEPQPEPTAPPEVEGRQDDFYYQPREVWAEQEQEAFLDEAAEQEDEPDTERTASEQTTFIAVPESQWPANDLTGEYPAMRDELAGRLDGFTEPAPDETQLVEPVDLDAPRVHNGVLEKPASYTDSGPAHRLDTGESAFTEPDDQEQYEQAEYAEAEPGRQSGSHAYQPGTEHQADPAHQAEPAAYQPDSGHQADRAGFQPGPAHEAEPAAYQPDLARQAEPAHQEQPAYAPEPAHQEQPAAFAPDPAHQPEPSLFTPQQAHQDQEPAQPAAFSAFGDTSDSHEFQPRAVAAAFEHPVESAPAKPEPKVDRPRSLFEPILDADEPLPPTGQTRPVPDTSQDQPFVPKFVPSDVPLLAAPEPEPEPEPELPARTTTAGLPIREARKTTPQRQQSFPAFQAFEAPKPEAPPAAALPVRPRPVGFSPSTGGRPNGATTRYQQPEGFNPRSPFGPGSVLPRSDGHAPANDFAVKATLTGRRYYTAESANFVETRADVWFRTVSDAEKAGFRPAP